MVIAEDKAGRDVVVTREEYFFLRVETQRLEAVNSGAPEGTWWVAETSVFCTKGT